MSETCRGHLWEKIIVKLFASSWYIFLTYSQLSTVPVQLSSTSSWNTSYHDSNTHCMTTIHNSQCWLRVCFASLLYFPTNHIPPYSQVLLEKLLTPHLVLKFPAFYRTLRLIITVFITPHNWSTNPSQINPVYTLPSFSFKIYLHIHPVYTSVFQTVSFLLVSPTKTLHMFLFSPM